MMNPLRIPVEMRDEIAQAESTEVRNSLVRKALAEMAEQKNLDALDAKVKKARDKTLKSRATKKKKNEDDEEQESLRYLLHTEGLETLPTVMKDRSVDALLTVHPAKQKSGEWLEGVERFLSKNANVLILCPSLDVLLYYKNLRKPSWLRFIGEIVWVQYDVEIQRKKHHHSGVWYIAHLNGEKNYPFYGGGLPNYVRGERLLEEDILPPVEMVTAEGVKVCAFEGVRKPDDEYLRLDEYQVPLWLSDHLVGLFTAQGDVVLDPHMRSGSFMVSGVKGKRMMVGCEVDPQMLWITKQRLEALEVED